MESMDKKMRKIYISGKMGGLEMAEVIARFSSAERMLRCVGYKTVNPARFFVFRHTWAFRMLGYRLTLLSDLWRLSHCDAIYMLDGWRDSPGAVTELAFAKAIGKKVLFERKWV